MNAKEKLIQLEETGKYVFHGSADGTIKELEPRQGRHVPDMTKPTETILDGAPAVSATLCVEFAIFRAILNSKNIPFSHTIGFGINKTGEKEYKVSSEKVLDVVKDKKGFVYVFNKDEFEPYNRNGGANEHSMEWRSYQKVKPIEVIEVDASDLPSKDRIQIR